ncbi:anhydro-N-acetylmuramic acid kinase [Shewanella sp. NIFS-20-20]|uniref:anhydro-N-acetylmuramic acid kinase n=1 Tax=Shewanella sp. NIFS-20-20 TaxID=2853806 RepID=UPI001C482FCB|nr:anhydro-N-acetylmuramic acid kinase [Shewanella sp. NIFS-20-20]MBV7314262.1 anhydro-N-acetylmuramic acid kinase [Shewanella sp. NIFS-20-20]
MTALYIGIMSGTSMDGVDTVLVDFSGTPQLVCAHSEVMPDHLRKGLQRLCQPASDEINRLGRLDRTVAELCAKATNALLKKAGVSPSQVTAIGCHGQTIRHMPNLEVSFTLQIGDPNTLAVLTGIDVIADFRRKDIALGGQGAPLVPAFHQQVFASKSARMIVNIGGMANITYLPGNAEQVLGFDTGPGNVLIDYWMQQCHQQPYDKDGDFAKQGQTDLDLLQQMLSHSYFAQPYPKSTGRELFNQAWLSHQLADFSHLADADIQSSLLDLTCHSIANDITAIDPNAQVFICGGGAFNGELMRRLQRLLPSQAVLTTEQLGVSPTWVEAIAFAWLALRFKQGLCANLPAVTGANRPGILGALYCAQ